MNGTQFYPWLQDKTWKMPPPYKHAGHEQYAHRQRNLSADWRKAKRSGDKRAYHEFVQEWHNTSERAGPSGVSR